MKRIRFSARRKIVGLSQEALAEQLGVDVSTVRRWEYGEREPQPWQRINLAAVLNVTLEDLNELLLPGDAHDEEPGYVPYAKAHSQIGNPGLDALIRGAGYASLQHFAKAVNDYAHSRRKLCTTFDHLTVKRWLAGSHISNPDAVVAVLSDAWGIPIPAEVIWPQLRNGKPPAPAQLQPWVASRTLETLGIFIRTDMLTRRETLTEAVKVVSGSALLAPIARWLDTQPGRLESRDQGGQRIGANDVESIERSTRYFAAGDANLGGTFSREAAVGQLKYAIDLAKYASYTEATGNRLLAAIAELSGLVGWLSHDSGMAGPAQKYFTCGLQAARESADPRAKLLIVSILADMGQQMRWLGQYQAALDLHDLALRQLPSDPRLNPLRGLLIARRAENGLCRFGPSRLPEVRDTLKLSFDLYGQASDDDRAAAGTMWYRVMDVSVHDLAAPAAVSYLTLAEHEPRLVAQAEKHTLDQIADIPDGQTRTKAFGQIRLTQIRFLAGEAEQACDDGTQALDLAERVKSAQIQAVLRELVPASEPFTDVPRVVEFRDRLREVVACRC